MKVFLKVTREKNRAFFKQNIMPSKGSPANDSENKQIEPLNLILNNMKKYLVFIIAFSTLSGYSQTTWNNILEITSNSEIVDLGMVQNTVASCVDHGATIINMRDASSNTYYMKLLYFSDNTGAILLEKDFLNFVGKQIIFNSGTDFVIIGFSTIDNQLQILKVDQSTGNFIWRTGIATNHAYYSNAVITQTKESQENYIFSYGSGIGTSCPTIGKINGNGVLLWLNKYCANYSKMACTWAPKSIINRHDCGEFDGIILAITGCGNQLFHVYYDGTPVLWQVVNPYGTPLSNILLDFTPYGYVGIANSVNNPSLYVFTFDNTINIKGVSLSALDLNLVGKSVFFQHAQANGEKENIDILLSTEGDENNRTAFVSLNIALNTLIAGRSYQPDLNMPAWSPKLVSMHPREFTQNEPYYIRGYTDGIQNQGGNKYLYLLSAESDGNAPCSDDLNVEISCLIPEIEINPLSIENLSPQTFILGDNSSVNNDVRTLLWCEGEGPIYPRMANQNRGDDLKVSYDNSKAQIVITTNDQKTISYSFELSDLLGRTVKTSDYFRLDKPIVEIDYPDLPTGVYLLKAFHNGQLIRTFKVVRSGK
jgi:hypothetical protein